MHVRTALEAGEDRLVHLRGVFGLAEQHAAAGAPQGLVGRGRDDVGIGDRALVDAGDDQAGDVGDVADEIGADLLGDLTKDLEIDRPGVGGSAGNDDLRPVFLRQVPDQIEIQAAGLRVDLIGHGIVEFAGQGDLPAVGQMAAVIEGHSHNRVARVDQSGVGRQIRDRTGVRLDVGMVGPEQLLGPVPRQFLDQVGDLLSLVVAFAGVAFRIFVGQAACGRRHHGPRDVVLRRDQSDRPALPGLFLAYQLIDLRIVVLKSCLHTDFSINGSFVDDLVTCPESDNCPAALIPWGPFLYKDLFVDKIGPNITINYLIVV